MRKIITLTTDFGVRDGDVSVTKGVIKGIARETELIDVAAAGAALAGLSPDADFEGAREAARRWRRKGVGSVDALARHLSRRGFASSAIFKVLKEMAPSTSDEEGAPAAEE